MTANTMTVEYSPARNVIDFDTLSDDERNMNVADAYRSILKYVRLTNKRGQEISDLMTAAWDLGCVVVEDQWDALHPWGHVCPECDCVDAQIEAENLRASIPTEWPESEVRAFDDWDPAFHSRRETCH